MRSGPARIVKKRARNWAYRAEWSSNRLGRTKEGFVEMRLGNKIFFATAMVVSAYACGGPQQTNSGVSEARHKYQMVDVQNRQYSPEVLWNFGRLGESAVSPDGTRVAYTVTRYDVGENRGWNELYVIPVDGKSQAQRVDLPTEDVSNVFWLDGERLAFVSSYGNGDKGGALYSVSAKGGDLLKISDVSEGIDGLKLSPDKKKAVFTSRVKVMETAADRNPDLQKSTGLVYDDLMYRHWNRWDDGTRSHVFLATFEEGKVMHAVDIMAGEQYDSPLAPFGGIEEIAWNAGSDGVAYTCKKLVGRDAAFSTNSDVYFYDCNSKSTSNLTASNQGYDRCPVYTPDGRYMLWLSMERAGFEADKDRLMRLDLSTGDVVELTKGFDYSASNVQVSSDSRDVYFVSGVQGTFQLYTIPIDGGVPTALTEGMHDYKSVALANDCLVGSRVSMVSPAELYKVALRGGAQEKLTSINDELLARIDMPEVRSRWVTTTDNQKMLTWVVLPPRFDSSKRYPALLFCEGGPQSALSQFWSYRWNLALMAAQGYVVVAPNRRGVLTFGQKWTDEISRHHGGQEMKDLLRAMDELAKEPWVDEGHLGAVGASYGGFTVNWLAGHHEKRFKAFISHCGIFHSEMEYYTTEELFFDAWEMGGAPWEKGNAVAQASFAQSPHKFVENWDTPIMLIHGEQDFRIPYTQALAAFDAARMRGIESRLLIFPDECHWVVKPQNGLLWQREFFRWLDAHLK